ncbi:hypothetical protein [Pseudoflavonifractor phocaeensis]|uniref:hypothetical protein n=1 Tax=Pseudoflavonifractor phocaeensis TaxID=1870988 RepID=UPI00195696B5|nr:hypothetical protein [Pseudoflavonifractor phocaeensis]MBM6925253.1 hypothetical protein [Pseudoflavonifractor phocaeensis]
MNALLSDLSSLAQEQFPIVPDAEAHARQRLLARHLDTVRAGLGEEFMDKLWETLVEQGQADQEAAFLRGLRLGLALHRL